MVTLGLTGKNGAGKSTVCQLLKEKYGYIIISLSDFIKDNLASKEIEQTRENMILEGNRLRKEYSCDYLALKAIEMIKKCQSKNPDCNFVIDSLRNDQEIVTLKKELDLKLVYVKSNLEVRYQRIKDREMKNSSKLNKYKDYIQKDDFKTIQEFSEKEKQEFKSNNKYSQQLISVFKMKDYTISNSGDLNDLQRDIQTLLNSFDNTD